MELSLFAANFPELYTTLNNHVRYIIEEHKMNGEESLRDWDNMIDDIIKNYEQEDYYGQEMWGMWAQQVPFTDFRDRDDRDDRDRRDRRDRDRRRRRFRDFDLRDITRLLFLRELFDRNRR